MFEAAELGRRTTKEEYAAVLPDIRSRLLEAQRKLRATKHPVIVIVSGVEGAGKSELVNRLHEWLDARGIQTHAFWVDSDEENERPRYWRFWQSLPARGTIGIMFGSWYTQPIVDRAMKKLRGSDFDRELQRIVFFERMLAEDGALIVKLWFHLPKKEQHARLEAKESRKNTNWTFAPDARRFAKNYDRFAAVSERALRATDTAEAPWHVIEATDPRYRDLTAARILLEALEDLVSEKRPAKSTEIAIAQADESSELADPEHTVLDKVDLSGTTDPEEYEKDQQKLQSRLGRLAWESWNRKRSTVVLLEGWDASGKGGAIRRMIAGIDARLYRIISVAAPTEEERAHHYLWRFWRHLPRAGNMTIYDRSWYGRVLVERVEGFARPEEWSRAYREINDFEEQLAEGGITLVKLWLHIDPDEQLRRFHEREKTPWKQYKIGEEDWRNRARWNEYKSAVHDMVTHTSSAVSPWTLVPANDKHGARVAVLRAVAGRMKKALA